MNTEHHFDPNNPGHLTERIAALKAQSEGKPIQVLGFSQWNHRADDEDYPFSAMLRYRPAPEPVTRPWRPEEVPLGKIVVGKSGWFPKEFRGVITAAGIDRVLIGLTDYAHEDVLRKFTMDDGSPCGITQQP